MADKRNLKQRAKDAGNVWKAGKSSLAAEFTPDIKKRLLDIGIIVGVTVLLLAVYYYFVKIWAFEIIFTVYMTVWVIFFVAYWIYNRGFTRKGVTPEMLPDEWSDAKKEQFIEDGKRRQKKSRWMIFVIVPLCFVFIVEIAMVFLIPSLYEALLQATR